MGQGASQLPTQACSTSGNNHKKRSSHSPEQSEAPSWAGTWGASGFQDAAGVSLSAGPSWARNREGDYGLPEKGQVSILMRLRHFDPLNWLGSAFCFLTPSQESIQSLGQVSLELVPAEVHLIPRPRPHPLLWPLRTLSPCS